MLKLILLKLTEYGCLIIAILIIIFLEVKDTDKLEMFIMTVLSLVFLSGWWYSISLFYKTSWIIGAAEFSDNFIPVAWKPKDVKQYIENQKT